MPQVIIFDGCGIAVEDLVLPSGEQGKCINIIDQDGSKAVFRYMMNNEQAKTIGTKLMGLGDIVIPTAVAQDIPPINGHKKH